ncbi:hypothetical protein [Aestuariimicrobium sp. T2.26MG-19.2B]|uniref:hypothetical protein n=1 Tax=Aestuariimicrobium sp. T2.26MG-19.2B TaxID=3040679 RepID=UPI002477A442|nr:hypothetical protein [Aestuariimicrobium sp. T2.26MG-19.2B]CAI9400430.1 hypothetical protein AESSP_00386 [Aestuariimicrobium sp. T2.26MG-19.2B]
MDQHNSPDTVTVYRVSGTVVVAERAVTHSDHPGVTSEQASYWQGDFLPDDPAQFPPDRLDQLVKDGQVVAYHISRKDV